jgi:hypothetical protein
MFMISRETLDSVMSLRQRIADPKQQTQCAAEMESMIAMKEAHLARSEWGSCCGNICNLGPQIEAELKILRNALAALAGADFGSAASWLQDYIALLQQNYRPEPDHW